MWINGGVKPGVDRTAWDTLDESERAEIFDVAACISTAGQVAERIVIVTQSGNGPEIETRRVANDRNFAAEAVRK